jgi:hypothetical protein
MADAKSEQPKRPLSWVKSTEGVVDVYVNSVHFTWSLDDVRIRMGQMVDSPDTPNPGPDFVAVSEERVAVTFTWRNAMLVRDQLSILIEAYEKVNGPIKADVKLVPAPF